VYTSFFGFKEKPFNLTPDARYLFLSPHHKEALDHLLYGINERKGFIAIPAVLARERQPSAVPSSAIWTRRQRAL